jgi:hypothetical protein
MLGLFLFEWACIYQVTAAHVARKENKYQTAASVKNQHKYALNFKSGACRGIKKMQKYVQSAFGSGFLKIKSRLDQMRWQRAHATAWRRFTATIFVSFIF